MFRLLIAVGSVAVVLASDNVIAQTVSGINVLEYGLYTTDKTNCKRDAQGIQRCDRSNLRHAATTTNVPREIGVEFGLRYRVVGSPGGAPVTIKRVWRIPGPGLVIPGKAEPVHSLERFDEVAIGGAANLVTYGFDDPWELVSGTWILEFWYRDVKVGDQRFSVVDTR